MLEHPLGSLVLEPVQHSLQPQRGQSASCCSHDLPDLIDVLGGMSPRPGCAPHPLGGSPPALAATPLHLARRTPLLPVPAPADAFQPALSPQSAKPPPAANRRRLAGCPPPRASCV